MPGKDIMMPNSAQPATRSSEGSGLQAAVQRMGEGDQENTDQRMGGGSLRGSPSPSLHGDESGEGDGLEASQRGSDDSRRIASMLMDKETMGLQISDYDQGEFPTRYHDQCAYQSIREDISPLRINSRP
jgi:hypothetical protein